MLDKAIATKPYGFLVKPFREKDVLVMLDVAAYLHQHSRQSIDAAANHAPSLKDTGELKSIVGQSAVFRQVLDLVKKIAPSDISALLLGESGTGKEVIARAIHQGSSRRNRPFVVVNCGALPSNLIEAELFGHEKGAFTGAMEKRMGKFEQADGGTIFLD